MNGGEAELLFQGCMPSQWLKLDLNPHLAVRVAFSALYSFLVMAEAAHRAGRVFGTPCPPVVQVTCK